MRYRLLPANACALLNSEGGRQSLNRAGNTTSGLSTIDSQNVKGAKVMLPPVDAQNVLASHAETAESIFQQQAEAIEKICAASEVLQFCVFVRFTMPTSSHVPTASNQKVFP